MQRIETETAEKIMRNPVVSDASVASVQNAFELKKE
jgi:hypothetical protein